MGFHIVIKSSKKSQNLLNREEDGIQSYPISQSMKLHTKPTLFNPISKPDEIIFPLMQSNPMLAPKNDTVVTESQTVVSYSENIETKCYGDLGTLAQASNLFYEFTHELNYTFALDENLPTSPIYFQFVLQPSQGIFSPEMSSFPVHMTVKMMSHVTPVINSHDIHVELMDTFPLMDLHDNFVMPTFVDPMDSTHDLSFQEISFTFDIEKTAYDVITYLASRDVSAKFMASNISYYLFYGIMPLATGERYVDTAIKGATFSTINAYASPIIINMIAEPIYDQAKACVDQTKAWFMGTPQGDIETDTLTLQDIFDATHSQWQESLKEIKPLSDGQIITTGIYSGVSKYLRDMACNAMGVNFLCRLLDSMPVSNLVKNTIKTQFGDNLLVNTVNIEAFDIHPLPPLQNTEIL